jgi:hypothetical protein
MAGMTEWGMMSDWSWGENVLALSVWLPAQADIQNALNEGLVRHACAFSRLGKIFTIG